MTHTQHALKWLKTGKTLTQAQAYERWSDSRLAATVYKLRGKGHKITTIEVIGVNKFGNTTRYAKYKLVKG